MSTEPYNNLLRRLKLRELRILVQVAESGSFHAAARASHVSQPAITTAVGALENALGVRLFERTPTGVVPTPSGVHLILRARAIFGELKLALEELDALNSEAKRVLHVGSVALPASGLLPVALEEFHRQYSDVSISVQEASEQVLQLALKSRRVDLYFSRLSRNDKDPAFSFTDIYGDTLCVIANKKHSLARVGKVAFMDLMGESWVLPPAGSFFHDHIQRVLNKSSLPMPTPTFETLSATVMHGLIARGSFIGFSTRSVYKYNPVKPFVTRLNVDLPQIPASVGVVSLKDRPIDPAGAQLIEIMKRLAPGS